MWNQKNELFVHWNNSKKTLTDLNVNLIKRSLLFQKKITFWRFYGCKLWKFWRNFFFFFWMQIYMPSFNSALVYIAFILYLMMMMMMMMVTKKYFFSKQLLIDFSKQMWILVLKSDWQYSSLFQTKKFVWLNWTFFRFQIKDFYLSCKFRVS